MSEIIFIEDYMRENDISQIYISPALKNFSESHNFLNMEYKSKDTNTLFFGAYRNEDLEMIYNHNGKIWVLWYDNDCNPKYKNRRYNVKFLIKRKKIIHLTHCINTKIYLNYYKIKSKIINLNYNILDKEKVNKDKKYLFNLRKVQFVLNLDELFEMSFNNINYNINNNIITSNNYIHRGEYSNKKISEIMLPKFNKYSKKFITFLLILKNRSNRFNIHYRYINKIKEFFLYADYIIVEDNGYDNINCNNLNENIKYFQVNSNVEWSRSKLINFGLSHVKTELTAIIDVDFIFPSDYIYKLIECCNMTDFRKNILCLSCYETNDSYKENKILRYAYELYGGIWIFNTELIKKCGGYNFDINGHGNEERELEERLNLYNINTIYGYKIYKNIYILHFSHDDDTRIKNNLTKKMISENIKKINYKYNLPIIKTNQIAL